MAQITKAMLASELADVKAQLSKALFQLEAERAIHARHQTSIPVAKAVPNKPQWQIDRAAAMAQAKAKAMQTKQMVTL